MTTRVPCTSTVLSGLGGGVCISNVHVSTVNEAGLIGDPAVIDTIRTAEPTRQQLLWDELERVQRALQQGSSAGDGGVANSKTQQQQRQQRVVTFLDSDVLHGSFSRFGCAELYALLKKELRLLYVDELERVVHFAQNTEFVYSTLYHTTPYRWNLNELMLHIKQGIETLRRLDPAAAGKKKKKGPLVRGGTSSLGCCLQQGPSSSNARIRWRRLRAVLWGVRAFQKAGASRRARTLQRGIEHEKKQLVTANPDFETRHVQFLYKLSQLQAKVHDVEQKRQWCESEQGYLVGKVRSIEEDMRNYENELDVAS